MEPGCRGGQGSPRVVAPTGRHIEAATKLDGSVFKFQELEACRNPTVTDNEKGMRRKTHLLPCFRVSTNCCT
jgi:hypothetical protein